MLQLIKYEFIKSWKLNLLGLIICLIGYALYSLYILISYNANIDFTVQSILSSVLLLTYLASITAPLIFLFISMKKTLIDSMFSDEGYLTMSLPISTKCLLCSKILVLLIWEIGFVIINFIGGSIVSYMLTLDTSNALYVSKLLFSLFFGRGVYSIYIDYSILIYLIKAIMVLLFVGAMTNYLRATKNKVLVGIGIGFAVITCMNMLNSIASLIPFGIIQTTNGYAFHFGQSLEYTNRVNYVFNLTSVIMDFCLIVTMYIISYKIIDKDFELN